MDVEGCLKKKMGREQGGGCVCQRTVETVYVGVNASYKCITYDPLGRETDGVCSGK